MYYCTLCIKNNDNDHFNVKYEGISNSEITMKMNTNLNYRMKNSSTVVNKVNSLNFDTN